MSYLSVSAPHHHNVLYSQGEEGNEGMKGDVGERGEKGDQGPKVSHILIHSDV